jgi:hypothetical protein
MQAASQPTKLLRKTHHFIGGARSESHRRSCRTTLRVASWVPIRSEALCFVF